MIDLLRIWLELATIAALSCRAFLARGITGNQRVFRARMMRIRQRSDELERRFWVLQEFPCVD